MTLAIFTAGDALAAALAAPGLPAATRNDVTLQGFLPTSEAGFGWKLAVNDKGANVLVTMMGEPPEHELGARYTVALGVEGEPGAARDTVFRAACAALAAALFPGGVPLAVDGVFDDLEIEGGVEIIDFAPGEQGNAPVIAIQFDVSLTLTAATPFG